MKITFELILQIMGLFLLAFILRVAMREGACLIDWFSLANVSLFFHFSFGLGFLLIIGVALITNLYFAKHGDTQS